MNTHAWMLGALLALVPLANAGAADNAAQEPADKRPADDAKQEVDACKQQQRAEGEKTEIKTAIKCAVKSAFQSRIRHKKADEQVEMTIGSPPMVTDDTDTPGDGTWEINLGLHTESGGGERRIEIPTIDVNYGVGDAVQLKYEVPYTFLRTTDPATGDSQSANGFGESLFGVKYRFYDNKDAGLSFAIYPQVEFRTPGGNRFIAPSGTGFVLPIIMTKEYEHFAIGANLGAEFTGGSNNVFASFGGGWRLSDRTAMFTELAGDNLNSADEKRIALNIGLRHKISDKNSISGSIGRDVYAGGDQSDQTYFTLVWQIDIGK